MKKHSALTVAGGLVGALLSGVVGYTIRLTGGQVASTATAQPANKPIVKTITSTIRIKKKPKVRHVSGPTSSVRVSTSTSASQPPTASTGGSHPANGGDDGGEGGDD